MCPAQAQVPPTDLQMTQLVGMQDMQNGSYEPNSAQRLLAEEVTRFVHGQQGLNEALRATQVRSLAAVHTLCIDQHHCGCQGAAAVICQLEAVPCYGPLGRTLTDAVRICPARSHTSKLLCYEGLALTCQQDCSARSYAGPYKPGFQPHSPAHKRWVVLQALSPGGSTKLDAASLEAIAGEAPSVSRPRSEVVGCALSDLLAAVGMQPSKSAARRLIKASAVPPGSSCSGIVRPERLHKPAKSLTYAAHISWPAGVAVSVQSAAQL